MFEKVLLSRRFIGSQSIKTKVSGNYLRNMFFIGGYFGCDPSRVFSALVFLIHWCFRSWYPIVFILGCLQLAFQDFGLSGEYSLNPLVFDIEVLRIALCRGSAERICSELVWQNLGQCPQISQRVSSANFLFSAFFLQDFMPPKKSTPKIHAQTCRHSSPIYGGDQNSFNIWLVPSHFGPRYV